MPGRYEARWYTGVRGTKGTLVARAAACEVRADEPAVRVECSGLPTTGLVNTPVVLTFNAVGDGANWCSSDRLLILAADVWQVRICPSENTIRIHSVCECVIL